MARDVVKANGINVLAIIFRQADESHGLPMPTLRNGQLVIPSLRSAPALRREGVPWRVHGTTITLDGLAGC